MSKEMILQVERVVGSNIVLARSHQNTKEYVLIGKGLGFAFKVESTVQADDPRIEKGSGWKTGRSGGRRRS
ncbi:CAT RNA binding domain-containing protein [Paenibacillus amylolyticus]|uniref:CAT RNA binding domain-containing protein n=1 Tax=Paenibacillus amylolyticus TaxID=1451 RepID=UPI003D807E18